LSDFHPTRAAIIEAEGTSLGVIGQVNSQVASQNDVPAGTYVFELDFNQIEEMSGHAVTYQPLTRYPAVTRDLAVVVPDEVPYARVKDAIAAQGGELLESLTLFDVYTGPPLPAGQKNVAVSVIFRSRERTLRDAEVDDLLSKIKQALTAEFRATFREGNDKP
jgi:phenylalanyl-tRNA synthetase beta chain